MFTYFYRFSGIFAAGIGFSSKNAAESWDRDQLSTDFKFLFAPTHRQFQDYNEIHIFFAKHNPYLQYEHVSTSEDKKMKQYALKNLNVHVFNNNPLVYIRAIHKNNTSVYVSQNKNHLQYKRIPSVNALKSLTYMLLLTMQQLIPIILKATLLT